MNRWQSSNCLIIWHRLLVFSCWSHKHTNLTNRTKRRQQPNPNAANAGDGEGKTERKKQVHAGQTFMLTFQRLVKYQIATALMTGGTFRLTKFYCKICDYFASNESKHLQSKFHRERSFDLEDQIKRGIDRSGGEQEYFVLLLSPNRLQFATNWATICIQYILILTVLYASKTNLLLINWKKHVNTTNCHILTMLKDPVNRKTLSDISPRTIPFQ